MNRGFGIGSIAYVFDTNSRKYDENNSMIWRHQWRPLKIVGETSRSWLTDFGMKLPKNDKNNSYLTSDKEIDEQEWIHDNVHRMERFLSRCKDYEKIMEIARLLDYEITA